MIQDIQDLVTLRGFLGETPADCLASNHVAYTRGWKYQLAEHFFYRLRTPIKPLREFDGRYYAVFRDAAGNWWLWGKIGCCYDGPTWYPDFPWTMGPALVHDILHWLIAKGIIPETFNRMIDDEFRRCILDGKHPIPLWQGGEASRKVRAYTMYKAVNLVNQRVGDVKPIHYAYI